MNCLRSIAKGVHFDVNKYKLDAELFRIKAREHQTVEEDDVGDTHKTCAAAREVIGSKRKLLNIENDRIQKLRKEKKILVKGEDIPKPLKTFHALQEFEGTECVLQNITRLGFKEPTAVQMQAIPIMLNRRELICCAPTGSGKTLAFLLPLIIHLKEAKNCGFRALILAPTRELAKQIHRECIFLSFGTGLRTHLIKNVYLAKKQFGLNSKLKFDILVTTPNRLVFLLKQEPVAINISNIEWLVIDECDKLFETSFRDQLAVIYNACTNSNNHICRALFSATFDTELQRWFQMHLENVITLIVGRKNRAADSVEQKLMFVGSEEGKLIALRELIASGLETPLLIFVDNIKKAQKLCKELSNYSINVDVIHSEKTNEQRDLIVRKFREGKIWFLICTELMGRGIDFKGINLIINYDIPKSEIAYIHRIGRTGRAGRRGKAITFFTESDINECHSVIKIMHKSGADVPDYLIEKLMSKRKSKQNTRNRKRLRKTSK